MTLTEISNIRIISQKIASAEFKSAKEVVSWMGAMQAQDYSMAKWAIGIRKLHSTDQEIESSINKGEIIRTHLMRPTLHFVAADDIYWMLELTASQIKSLLKSRNKVLELSEDIFTKSHNIIEKALSKGINLTREELAKELDKFKIRTDENRLSHFLLRAELEGLICNGPIKDKKLTYALLRERVPKKKILPRDEALAELAKRFFTSHCPATLKDFVWWSGLSVKDARQGLESVKSDFISETIGSEMYWLTNSFTNIKYDKTSVHLLPAFDEFLISYKNRKVLFPLENHRKAISENGIFRPVIVINGLVVGLWKRIIKKDKVIIETEFFQPVNNATLSLIKKSADKFGLFLNKEIEVKK